MNYCFLHAFTMIWNSNPSQKPQAFPPNWKSETLAPQQPTCNVFRQTAKKKLSYYLHVIATVKVKRPLFPKSATKLLEKLISVSLLPKQSILCSLTNSGLAVPTVEALGMVPLTPMQLGNTDRREGARKGCVCRVTLLRKQESSDSCNAPNLIS